MRRHIGWVKEIHKHGSGSAAAWISCPPAAIPQAGRYVLAADKDNPFPIPLFTSRVMEDGFLSAPPMLDTWAPGTSIILGGPLGHGFSVPEGIQRLALAAFDITMARLFPLVQLAIRRNISVAVFTDAPPVPLPAEVEINSLAAVREAISWADFLAVDLSAEELPQLQAALGLDNSTGLPCRGQALIVTPMPCGGIADCGVCAVSTRKGWKLTCKDGPVVDLKELLTV